MNKLALCAALLFGACSNSQADKPVAEDKKHEEVASLTVDQVDKMIAANEGTAVDCNGDRLRKQMGVLPNAILLSDDSDFKATELPPDHARKLVFYCHDSH